MKQQLTVFKIGGNVIDNPEELKAFLVRFSTVKGAKVLIHGGGKIATKISARLGIESQMIEGRRVTSEAELEVVTMVYAGLISKQIVAGLQALNVNAVGLSGADGNTLLSDRRSPEPIDYGHVGDVKQVDAKLLDLLVKNDFVPVLNAITHDGNGNLLNTNADTIAAETAVGLSDLFDVSLVYCFEKAGVLYDVNDEDSIIVQIDTNKYEQLKTDGIIDKGMLPKLKNCFYAINNGVSEVRIASAENLEGQTLHTKIRI